MEGEAVGHVVGSVSAHDDDADGPNAQFFYRCARWPFLPLLSVVFCVGKQGAENAKFSWAI